MSSEQNKETLRRFSQEVISKGNMTVVDDLLAQDYVNHNPLPGQEQGRQGFKQSVLRLRAAFPDLQETIDELIADGDRVVVRATRKGTHRAPFMGIPPTGKSIDISATYTAHITDGKISDIWLNWDTLGLVQQLGAKIAPPGKPM